MDNQEKIFKNKNASQKQKKKTFLQWKSLDASEEKLDEKKTKSYCTLEKISHCRFTPIVFSLGYQFIKTDSKVITQAERKKTA
jgi:hypothetical protein